MVNSGAISLSLFLLGRSRSSITETTMIYAMCGPTSADAILRDFSDLSQIILIVLICSAICYSVELTLRCHLADSSSLIIKGIVLKRGNCYSLPGAQVRLTTGNGPWHHSCQLWHSS